ncbi:hypothetical protein OL548_27115 [Lysinibacillus sp. MHQ-1]|nr:hypothetical protein OL548_27115 [Lysinibacillus sp. MHQ-1]
MAAFALELADILHEVRENIPAIEKAERLANGKEQRLYYERKWSELRRQKLKQQTTKKWQCVLYTLSRLQTGSWAHNYLFRADDRDGSLFRAM